MRFTVPDGTLRTVALRSTLIEERLRHAPERGIELDQTIFELLDGHAVPSVCIVKARTTA